MLRTALVLLTFSSFSFAADVSFMDLFNQGKNFFTISAGIGGDAIVITSEGDELNAGDGLVFQYGRDARYSDRSKRFIRFSIGYKYGFLRADNGTATITAIPINALYMQQDAKLVYGAGLTLHLQPTVKTPGGGSDSESLEIGFTGQVGYRLANDRTVGITADFIDYDTASANSIGIFYTKRFGVK